jgi:hypothetical protein
MEDLPMAQTTCIQCGSIYEEGQKFCPKDDTPLTRLVQCRKCHGPLRPDAPYCAHCRGAKASAQGPDRRKLLVALGGAAFLALVAFTALRLGPDILRAAKHGAGSILAATSWRPGDGPVTRAENAPARAPATLEGAHRPSIAGYDFRIHRPGLLGDAPGGTASTVNGGPIAPPRSPGREASRESHSRKPAPSPNRAAHPVLRRTALHVPAPVAEAWRRDGEIEGRLAGLGMPGVRVMRKDRSLRLSGTVASDGDLRTLYRLIHDLGYGEVGYDVEVR